MQLKQNSALLNHVHKLNSKQNSQENTQTLIKAEIKLIAAYTKQT